MKAGISIIMPAYNEAGNLDRAVSSVSDVCKKLRIPYEIIIINDGSSDDTGAAAQKIAKKSPHVQVIQSPQNMGFGHAFRLGLARASFDYTTLFPSDNEMKKESLEDLIKARNKADFISAYMANPLMRTIDRRIISHLFVTVCNLLFHLDLRYYTGPFMCKTSLVKQAGLASDGNTFLAELRIRLIGRGATLLEIPFLFEPRRSGVASVFRWKTIYHTAKILVDLVSEDITGTLRKQ
ncbi:MAG: glycosyltransferase family 2 protein [Candidatus Gottesmanbacteria bacterium]|nr:glycosyltransferase family 2 protein [Candidatus Gottesmanbacteria bacterium]